jgi:oxygen-independent coproporphyrinogen-3 oxidase
LEFEISRYQISNFKTVYIGGGTPSTLSPKLLEKVFAKIPKGASEITVEANPNSASLEWLREIKNFGATRISLGVQSFDSEKLKFLGRNHSKKDAILSLESASKVGFKDINLDLIYNTAIDSKELLSRDLEIAFSLSQNHMSLYSLTIEENTLFENSPEKSVENLENTKTLFEKVSEKFPQYEISNFGKPSLHNLGYWNSENYIGVGSGAVGFWKDRRFYPERDVKRYIENPLYRKEEILSKADLKFEKLFLGFRSKVGVSEKILSKEESRKADFLVSEKILRKENGRYFNLNFLLADEVTLKIV